MSTAYTIACLVAYIAAFGLARTVASAYYRNRA